MDFLVGAPDWFGCTGLLLTLLLLAGGLRTAGEAGEASARRFLSELKEREDVANT